MKANLPRHTASYLRTTRKWLRLLQWMYLKTLAWLIWSAFLPLKLS